MQDYEKTLLLKVSISLQNNDYISFTIIIQGNLFSYSSTSVSSEKIVRIHSHHSLPRSNFLHNYLSKKKYHKNMILSLFMIHKRSIKSCHSESSAFDQG